MKMFTNGKIRSLFLSVLLCAAAFAAAAVLLLALDTAKSGVCILAVAFAAFAAILMILYRYFFIQNKVIEKAEEQIADCISGSRSVRIECDDEGELNKLFHKVNSLVSILNANAEKEARSREFLKNTISDISHQLKTPLAALNIYNGIIRSETEDLPEIQEFASLADRELDRIETLVQSLLKLARFDAGTIRIEKKTENIYEMMDDIRRHFLFRTQREEKRITLTGDADASLLCDKDWLIQAMENIVKNALDHTKAGGLIQIEWKKMPSAVRIIVKDNGSGIHPEDIHHIFKRFYRSRFSKDTQGIGLGLPLSKAVIEAHNGSIEVDSEPGKGTVFTVNFLIPTKL